MVSFEPLSPMAEELRGLLTEHLPWSPVDYVPGISLQGDRAIFAEQLTAPLASENDLRIVAPVRDVGRVAVFAQRLPWDSDFFGLEIARLDGVFPLEPPLHRPAADLAPAVAGLLEQARSRGIRYLFAHVDPRDQALLRALGQHGFALIETRLHYHLSVQIVHYLRLPDHLPQMASGFRLATEEDLPSLKRVARESVNPYDRFHGDPLLDRATVDRLMETWIERSVTGEFADLTIVPDVERPTAFITYRFHKQHWPRWGLHLAQVVLSAVSPEALGWFAAVGPEVHRHLRAEGVQHCFGKTQITLGLDSAAQFGKGEHIFRIAL